MALEVAGHSLRSIVYEKNHWSIKTCLAASKKQRNKVATGFRSQAASRRSQVSGRKLQVSGSKLQVSKLKIPTTSGYFVLFIMCDL
jgi:hypothetical protein